MNKQQLANKIWASANKMHSKIDANEYKVFFGTGIHTLVMVLKQHRSNEDVLIVDSSEVCH